MYLTDKIWIFSCTIGLLFLLGLILVILCNLVGTSKKNLEKLSAYECGFIPFNSTRINFEIHYYVICILFLLFDLEISFLFFFVLSVSYISKYSFFFLFFFIFFFIFSFFYEVSQNLLSWNSVLL
jgi:NADH-quinone oxidoreductase subunit A